MNFPLRVLLVDDHFILVEGLKVLLADVPDLDVVAVARSGDEALYQLRQYRVDVMLLDINMPGRDGIDVLQQIRKQQLPLRVIGLSSYDDPGVVRQFMKAGGNGYVLKSISSPEIVRAIRVVAEGGQYITPSLQQRLAHRDDPHDPFPAKFRITERELHILRLIAAEKTSDEIAEQLCVSTHTIDAARKTLLKKLNVKSVVGLVNMAWRWMVV